MEAEILLPASSAVRVQNSMALPDGARLINIKEEGDALTQLLGASQSV